MNIMNMPGFTAESALLESRKAYYTSGVFNTELDLAVLPQVKKDDLPKSGGTSKKCEARCYGTYLASTLGCSFDKYPEICKSIATNTYNRCKSGCAGVLSPA
jgi:hypothetical protein